MGKCRAFFAVFLLMLGAAVEESAAESVQIQLVQQAAPAKLIFDPGEPSPDGYQDRCQIFIDGKDPFPARQPAMQSLQAAEMTLVLIAGKHTLTPGPSGGYDFTVHPDGTVATDAPGLIADGNRLKVLMVPLTFETRDGESGARRVPGVLQPVLDSNGEVFKRPWYFNPRYASFATVYVPVGSKFTLIPQGAQLEVGSSAVAIKSDPSKSLRAEGLTVAVTMMPFRFTFQRNGQTSGRGIGLTLQGAPLYMEHQSIYQGGAASCDYKVLLPAFASPFTVNATQSVHEQGRVAPQTPLISPVTFNTREYPCSSLLISRLDERSEGTTTFLAGIDKIKYESGEAVSIRYTFGQFGISPVMTGPHLAALLRPEQFTAEDTPPWQTLAVTENKGQATLKLPGDLSTNRYRLRLAVIGANDDAATSGFYRDFIVGVVNPAQQAVVSLFTPSMRWNYLAGEEIEMQGVVQLRSPAKGSLRLRVRGERIDRTFDDTRSQQFTAGRHEQGWVLGSELTGALKPGDYKLTAVFVDGDGKTLAESLPQRVTLVSPVRPSLFPGVIDCYTDERLGPWFGGSRDGARKVFGVGANVLRFDGWYVMLPGPPMIPMDGRPLGEGVLSGDPDLPSVETNSSPHPTWLALDAAMSYRAAIMPSLFPSDGPRIETQIPDLLAEQRRFIRLHVQYLRRYPTYAGIGYTHWSGPSYTGAASGSSNQPPDSVVNTTRKLIWENFCKTHGFTGDPPTNWLPLSIPWGGAATPGNSKLWEQWVRYNNALLPTVHRDWARAAEEICPQLVNTDSRGAPGYWNGPREAYDAYTVGNPYQTTTGFNLIETVTNDDWGIEPYSLELMADMFGFGWRQGKPVWVGGWAQNGVAQSEYQREAIQTLARGALPALYGASVSPVFDSRAHDDWMHQDWGRRQATERVFQTTAAYGEWASSFTTDKPLAILASFSQSGLVEGRAGYAPLSHHGAAIYEAYAASLLAGYSPTFIYEEEIAADPTVLNRFKGVLLIDITRPLPEPITHALKTFAANGGTVLADAASAADLPATARIPLTFDAYLKYGSSPTGFGKENNSTEYTSGYWWQMRKVADDKRAVLQKTLDPVARPAAQCDKPGVLLTSAHAGEGLLVFATNDTPLPYKYSTEMARPYIYLQQCWTSSEATANVTLHAESGTLYDALRLREVPLEKTADGLRFTASFPDISGTLYVLLPRPIQGVRVDGNSRPGVITLRARAVDKDEKSIPAPVPLEIMVTDAAQSERYHLYRAAGPEGWAEELPVGVNDAAGRWTVVVRELLSGKSVAATLDVQPAAPPHKNISRPPLIVTDRGAVMAFLKSMHPLTIALDRRQTALDPAAKRLAHQLAAAGRHVQVRWLDEMERGPVYNKMLWSAAPLPPQDPVKGAVILLGMPKDNTLLAKLADAGVLLREASEDYPGDGGAVITHVWSAFVGDDPVLAIMASSESGLETGISHLGNMLDGNTAGGYDPVPALERARTTVMPPLFRNTWAKSPLMPPSVPAKKLRALKHLDGKPGQSSEWVINPAGDAIRALAISADSQTYAVGTDSPIHGVIRIDKIAAQADVAAKIDGPRQNRQFVQQIALTPDGNYTIAATTQPPAVFVQDATGKELWSKTNISFNSYTDPRWELDEPDYFALSPRGDRVVIREKEQRLVCYETATGKQLWECSYASGDNRIWRDAHRLRFSGDGSRLIASIMSYMTNSELATKLGNTATEALGSDLKMLDGEARHQLLAIDPATGHVEWTRTERTMPVALGFPRGHPFMPLITPRPDLDFRALYMQPRVLGYYLSLSNDGGWICASNELGGHSIYGADGSLRVSFTSPGRPRLSPDGSTLAVYKDGVVLIDVATGHQQPLTLDGQEEISDVAWSIDGRSLAIARWDGLIQIVEPTGHIVGKVRQPHGTGAVLLPLPAGGWLAGTSDGRLVRINAAGE